MEKKYLVFDTESNGLPITHSARYTETSNWPRITQLAWGVYTESGEELSFDSCLIKPDGWRVPTSDFFVQNNMSTERCELEGVPFAEAFEAFIKDWAECDVLVAHNLSFDKPVIACEAYRYGLKFPKRIDELCTKLASEPICMIPGYRGKFKWPTLMEAHQYFFGKDFEGAHDAGNDVRACAAILPKILEYKKFEGIF